MEDAVARYRSATEVSDIAALVDTLALDAELVSPISGRLVFRGKDDLRILLGAVYQSLTDLRWHDEVGTGEKRVLIGDAAVGGARLSEAVVLDLSADGRIQRIRPHLRPWLGLTVLAVKLGLKLGRHPGLLWRAARAGSSGGD